MNEAGVCQFQKRKRVFQVLHCMRAKNDVDGFVEESNTVPRRPFLDVALKKRGSWNPKRLVSVQSPTRIIHSEILVAIVGEHADVRTDSATEFHRIAVGSIALRDGTEAFREFSLVSLWSVVVQCAKDAVILFSKFGCLSLLREMLVALADADECATSPLSVIDATTFVRDQMTIFQLRIGSRTSVPFER